MACFQRSIANFILSLAPEQRADYLPQGMKQKPWTIVEEKIYEAFQLFTLKRSTRKNPRTGAEIPFFLMEGLDWVNILALTKNKEALLVYQFRHGTNETTIELPGGCIEKGEEPSAAALRELTEETGYSAKNPILLGVSHANPAMQSMKCYHYLAFEAEPFATQDLDPGESIAVSVTPISEMFEMAKSGKITHALVLSCLSFYQLKGYGSADE